MGRALAKPIVHRRTESDGFRCALPILRESCWAGNERCLEDDAIASYSVIARSSCDEAIQNPSAERLWIASLRSQ